MESPSKQFSLLSGRNEFTKMCGGICS
ncbi:hypothetical protein PanWU01x14_286400 [Parasponia andersonii]|uniref:Uncharacterized protein n=1 Tax=Parasponia andersonii TaxID=3476 RepID=A0A2P5AYZ8_PARAD|nr:hypothetical protein PanWU01x14_286400 [Parasponia andersonii]